MEPTERELRGCLFDDKIGGREVNKDMMTPINMSFGHGHILGRATVGFAKLGSVSKRRKRERYTRVYGMHRHAGSQIPKHHENG